MNAIKKLIYFIPAIVLISIITISNSNYTEKTKITMQMMSEPIILVHKEKCTLWYSVILKDGNGRTYSFGNVSVLANSIGENYSINDTIPKNINQ